MQTHILAQTDQAPQQQNKTLQQTTQLIGEQRGEFADDRQEIAEGLQLQQMMNNSHLTVEGRVTQAMMNNSPQARAAQALQLMVNSQAQGPMQMKVGVQVNDDVGLEAEADVMGAKALDQLTTQNVSETIQREHNSSLNSPAHLSTNPVLQRVLIGKFDITGKSPIEDIEAALGWKKNYGIATSLTQKQKLALIDELKNHKDCKDILEELEDLSDDENELYSDDSEDDLTLAQSSLASLEKEEKAKARKKLADDFHWEEFPESIGNFNKIGVHETNTKEKSAALAEKGPSRKMINTGHGIGKGPGFYITPVGKKKLSTAIGAIEYGNELLAIYIDNGVKAFKSPSENHDHVDTLMKLAVLHSIEEHQNKLEFLIEDAHALLNEIDDGITISEKKLEELDLLADDIEKQLIKIEKDIKQLKRKLGKVSRMIDDMRKHRAEIHHPTDLYYFIMSGGGEIVIPVESYDKVRALNNKDSLQDK